jgi:hypothetical protein
VDFHGIDYVDYVLTAFRIRLRREMCEELLMQRGALGTVVGGISKGGWKVESQSRFPVLQLP